MKDEIIVKDGKFDIPPEFVLSENKRRLKIKTPWMTQVQTLSKDNWQVNYMTWYRHKPEKPYISEGFIELDNVRFKVIEVIKSQSLSKQKNKEER